MSLVDDSAQSDRVRDALTAAHLYYMQDLTMDAIAHELHTSRSSVSRLLSHARATGLVDIQIRSPLDAPSRLELLIHERKAEEGEVSDQHKISDCLTLLG